MSAVSSRKFWRSRHTALRGRGKESNFDLFLAQLVRKLVHRVPSASTDCLLVLLEIINEMDLSTCVHGDLIPRADDEARVVVRPEVHEALARSRVGLFVHHSDNRKLSRNACLEALPAVIREEQHLRRLRAGLQLGIDHTVRRRCQPMLHVRTR